MFQSKDDLKVFVLIFEKENLSAAAEVLRMTPGMVSKRLAQLEKEFGVRLFHRTTRQVQPTDEGRRLYGQVLQLLETIEGYEQEWNSEAEPVGLLKVAASVSFARLYLMPIVTAFLKEHPKVQIDLVLSDRIIDIVSEGVDVAIRIGEMEDSTLIAKKLGSSEMVVCASPSYLEGKSIPRKPSDLAQHNCIILNENCEWSFVKNGKLLTQKVTGNFRTNYGESMVQAAKAGLGIAIISVWHIPKELRLKELVPVLKDYELEDKSSIFAVYPSRRHLPMKTFSFLEYLKKNIPL